MTEYYKQFFIMDVFKLDRKTKVLITGVVLDMKIKEKFVVFTIDDTTGVIDCIVFKPSEKKIDITVGSIVTVSGEFEVEEYNLETNFKVIVNTYSILDDVNQELLFYLSTLAENNIQTIMSSQKGDEIEIDSMDVVPQTEKKIKKRIPLSDETNALKIRSLLFKFLTEEIKSYPHDDMLYTSTSDLLTCKLVSEFMERESIESTQIENGILDLERLNFISPIYEHSMVETSGTKYIIEKEEVTKVRSTILEMIKNSGAQGIKIGELYKDLNENYDTSTFMFSQHYIWEVVNEFFEHNEVYLGANNYIHYLEKL